MGLIIAVVPGRMGRLLLAQRGGEAAPMVWDMATRVLMAAVPVLLMIEVTMTTVALQGEVGLHPTHSLADTRMIKMLL